MELEGDGPWASGPQVFDIDAEEIILSHDDVAGFGPDDLLNPLGATQKGLHLAVAQKSLDLAAALSQRRQRPE